MFGLGALGDVFKSETLRGSEIVLVDINDKSLKEVESVAKKFIDDNRLDYTITATTDRRTALPGADFVLISIEVGDRYKLWEMDWHLPQQYGITGGYYCRSSRYC